VNRFFIVIFCFVVGVFGQAKQVIAGSYDMQYDFYQIAVAWALCNHGGEAAGDYMRLAYVSGASTYEFRTYQGGVLSTSFSGSSVGGTYVSSSSLGSTFTGYNGSFSTGYTYIYSDVNVINPSSIAFSGNSAYFPDGPYVYTEFPVWNNPGVCWGGKMLNFQDASEWFVGTGDCYGYGYPTPSPTPTPSTTTTTVTSTTTTTVTSTTTTTNPYPVPSVTVVNTPTGIVEGGFTYDPNTGVGTISVSIEQDVEYVDLDDEVYNVGSGTVGNEIPLADGSLESDYTLALQNYMTVGSSTVGAVSEGYFRPVVDWLLNMVMNHPVMSYFSQITFTVTSPVCSFTVDLFGQTIEFSFCNLDDEFLILRLVIVGIAGIYSVFIVLRGD
jgi:hypothetical protein